MAKKAIVAVSFGAVAPAARCALDTLCAELAAAFPSYNIMQAYTSEILRHRLHAAGIAADSLSECLQHLCGVYDDVLVQPLHFTPGEEYENKIKPVVAAYQHCFARLTLGEAAVQQSPDAARMAELLLHLNQGADGDIVYMGHGSPKRCNPVYELLQQQLDARGAAIHIGVLEEACPLRLSDVIARLHRRSVQRIVLRPLLLTAGCHVWRDMAGAAEISWQSRLEKAGFAVRVDMQALLEIAAYRAFCRQKVQRLLMTHTAPAAEKKYP